ncbi:MAG: hypothetical protein CMD74_02590 [Gammaproteobacteria bacterium]|nr:hypothetical protein [Gammaproteobacteria bacterium]
MGFGAYNLTFHNAVWCHIGKKCKISPVMKELILKMFGKYDRVDFVHMPGNPNKGGPYWCAVFFFNTITREARNKLCSGDCIRLKTPSSQYTQVSEFRFTLFRSKVQTKEAIRAKQREKAEMQAAWEPFEINSEEDVWAGAMDYN